MKIKVQDKSKNGEVFVRGVYGPKATERMLQDIDHIIKAINNDLRKAKA